MDLYLPPPADVSLLGTVMQIVMAYGVDEVIFLGDFNMTSTPDLDRFTSASRWSPGLGVSECVRSGGHLATLSFYPS